MSAVTRFAPSPTGLLHLGHALAAVTAYQKAAPQGKMLLRMEDLDRTRCKKHYEQAILQDLEWLGIQWSSPILFQSKRKQYYQKALENLRQRALVYPCFCTRKAIAQSWSEQVAAPHNYPPPYPQTCKKIPSKQAWQQADAGKPHALRLDLDAALNEIGHIPSWQEQGNAVSFSPQLLGDVVLCRKDGEFAYHLAAVVDDAAQNITLVTRGQDLFPATIIHRVLQEILQLNQPDYFHHRLVIDAQGERLAKRHDSLSLAQLRKNGISARQIRQHLSCSN